MGNGLERMHVNHYVCAKHILEYCLWEVNAFRWASESNMNYLYQYQSVEHYVCYVDAYECVSIYYVLRS